MTAFQMQPRQVSIKAAAHILGIHRSTIYRLETAKKSTLNRHCGRTMVPRSEVERLSPMPSAESAVAPKPPKLRLKKRKLELRLSNTKWRGR